MATPLNKFQKGQVLTASALNAVVDFVNDHEKRLQSQQLRPGTGYTFSTSTGGTSLQITPRGGDDGNETSSTPFRVSLTKGEFEAGCNYAISATSGTLFGTDGNSASYAYISKKDDEGKEEDNQKLYTYVDLDEENTYIACAKLKATAVATIPDPSQAGDAGETVSSETILNINRVLVHAIPFKCEFLYIDAKPLDEWQGNALYDVGQEASDDNIGSNANDYYGIAGGWNVYFPLALITFNNGKPSVQQLLHGDIYFYAHWVRSV